MIEKLPYDDVSVLVIDDDVSTRGLLVRILEIMGCCKVLEAADGGTGLRIAHESHPTLVICDVQMTPVDGMSFLGGLRHSINEQVARTPVLMFTADGTAGYMKKAKEIGVDGYIIKPFTPSGFSDRIREVVLRVRGNPVDAKEGEG